MRLTLEDAITRICAYIIVEDEETFFYGYPDAEKFRRKLKLLLGLFECNGFKAIVTDFLGKLFHPLSDHPIMSCVTLEMYITQRVGVLEISHQLEIKPIYNIRVSDNLPLKADFLGLS